ncbi:MAG: hypothetical protein ACOCP8_09565 [archaeon]
MGGKALKNIKTERKNTKDFFRIGGEIQKIVKDKLDVDSYIVKAYHNKETHGDLDLLLNIGDKNINLKEWIEETFKPNDIFNNNVISFDYDNFQIDFISLNENNFQVAKDFFDYSPQGNLVGKIAHKFGLKWGFNGLIYPYRNSNGNISNNFSISKDTEKVFKFLDIDYDKFKQGFDNEEEIFEWIISSKYFDHENFKMENLNHIDRKRNNKRADYQRFLKYLEDNKNNKKYNFKPKKEYLNDIYNFFPESDLMNKIKESEKINKENLEISNKFNGNLIMEKYPNLKGKELGNKIFNFKNSFENWRNYALNNSSEEIMNKFDYFLKN